MRANEFLQENIGKTITINVPITITIPSGSGDPVVDAGQERNSPELDANPVMVSPQQQELELAKAAMGKESPVIDKITASDTIGAEPETASEPESLDDQFLKRLRALINPSAS
jgi:hypothetical protein